MLRRLIFLLPLAVAVLAQNLAAYRPTLQPATTGSYQYSPDQFFPSIPILPGQHLQPGVSYEPRIIFVPKIDQPTSEIDDTDDQPAEVISQPAETDQDEVDSEPEDISEPEIAAEAEPSLPPVVIYQPEPEPIKQKPAPPTVIYTHPSYPSTYNLPNRVVTKAPPKAVLVRPIKPFKTEFQCPEGNGFYSIANSCDAYYECKGYVAVRRICPNGLYFNPAAKYSNYSPCSHPSEVQCTAGNVIQRYPTNPTEQCPAEFGYFAINDGECSRYIVCQEGLATIMNCPAGLVFNDQTQSCDWPVNVPQCHPNVFKDFTCPAPPVERNGEMSDIIYKYRNGSQCKSFVACQNGYPRLLSCDPGLSFDETSQSCISEELVTNCAAPYSAAVA